MLDNSFVSNTTAGCANQHYFISDGNAKHTFISFYRIKVGGRFDYSLSFSGLLDGTFRGISFPNELCDSWEILSIEAASAKSLPIGEAIKDIKGPEGLSISPFTTLTFDGGNEGKKAVADIFSTDPTPMCFDAGDYLCLKLTVRGTKIPCHPETCIPVYEEKDGEWSYTVDAPLPCKIGCNRPVSHKIGYFGDSITQGCGTTLNSYKQWNGTLSELIGDDYAHWNLGIGYGKASDAATLGNWFKRAESCDTVFLCFGVNDLNGDYPAETICANISKTVDALKAAGCRVIVQTPPPFDFPSERAERWQKVNAYILDELSTRVEAVFDVRPVLSLSPEQPQMTKYGGHPDDTGCTVWANALYEAIKHLF